MKRICFILSLCFVSLMSFAQNSNDELLKKLVEKQVLTQAEADDIKKESAKEEANKKTDKIDAVAGNFRNIFNNTPYFQLGGYGLFMYNYSNVNKTKHDVQGRVVFLSARGDLGNNIKYFFLTEFINPMLYEFWGEWTPAKQFNVRVGQMKVNYSLENQIALFDLETVFNTRSVSNLIGMGGDVHQSQNGKNNTGRDLGIQVSGTLLPICNNDLIQYSVGLFQGSGMNTGDKDNSKDVSATVLLQPVKGFRIGGSVYYGDATYSIGDAEAINHTRNRWMLSADYNSERFYARAEWIHGKDSKIDREGLYGTVKYYAIPSKLGIIAKVDYYNQDKNSNCEVMDYLAGVDYYFYKKCRFSLNYQYSDYAGNYPKKWKANSSHSVIGQLQFVF